MARKPTTVSPKGHATLATANGRELKLRLDFSAIADADEFLGRSLVSGLMSEPLNFHLLRVAIYFGSRSLRENDGLQLRSVKQAGALLDGVELEAIAQGVSQALVASGAVRSEGEEEGSAEGES